MIPDLHTEEVAEVRLLPESPMIPDLPPAALRGRLTRALPMLLEDPERARAILAAPPSPSHPMES